MKKVALLGLLSVAVMAGESGLYVGGEISQTKECDKASDGDKFTNKSGAYGLSVGYYVNDNIRTYGFYQHLNRGDFAQPTKAYGAGADYLIGDSNLKPFIGAIVGYSTYKDGTYKQDGLAYGGQIGIDYKVTSTISVDAGYRYLISDSKHTSGSYVEEVTSFQSFFAGANYKF